MPDTATVLSQNTHDSKTSRSTSRPQNATPALVSLQALKPGHCGQVREVTAPEDDRHRLLGLGICRGRRVQLVKHGDPLILRVYGSRIGLSARLAAQVQVEACAAESCVGTDH